MSNTKVIYMNLPTKVKGFVLRSFDDDEYYTIVLNSKHSFYQNIETLKHELDHITNDDFRSFLSADQIEMIRHN